MERNLMAVTVKEKNNGKVLEVEVHDKLTSDDYKRFVPEFDRLVKQHGKLRVLFEMTDFHGWEAGALWQDIKFETTHFRDIERLAIVGDKKWEKGMSEFCKPFTTSKIQYFDQSQLDQARQWIESN
jgi:SpoIIAA-like